MIPIRDQLEFIERGLAEGQISLRDYLGAIRGQMAPLVDVLDNIPLIARAASADPETVVRLHGLVAEILTELRSVIGEGSTT